MRWTDASVGFRARRSIHPRAIPARVHEVLAWVTLLTCAFTLQREWRVLGDNNRLIAEAALRREDTAGPPRG